MFAVIAVMSQLHHSFDCGISRVFLAFWRFSQCAYQFWANYCVLQVI
jgi:hypothetical protein